MAGKRRNAAAAKRPPLIREHGGVFMQRWRDGGRVRCRGISAAPGRRGLSAGPHASAASRPTGTECGTTSAGSADCRSDQASWKALASRPLGAGSSGRQCPARRRMLSRKQSSGRLPRSEGWPRRSRLSKKIWHPLRRRRADNSMAWNLQSREADQ